MVNRADFVTWTVCVLAEVKSDISQVAAFIGESADDVKYGERFASTSVCVINSMKTWLYSNLTYGNEFDDNIRRIEIPGYNAALIYKTYDQTLEVIAVMAFHTLRDPEAYERIISERVKIADTKLRKSEDK